MFYLTYSVDTSRAVKKIEDVSTALYKEIQEETRKQLEAMAKSLQEFIEEQKGQWAALNDKYLEQKVKKGLDPRILIATGEYIKSIKVKQVGTKFMIYPEGHEQLAEWLEFGTDRMPPRVHWSYLDMKIRYTLKYILHLFAHRKAQELSAKYR